MYSFKRLYLVLFALVLLVAVPAAVNAQTTTSGDLAGTVTDPQGAVVPNASVTLTNDATGQQVKVTTNGSGYFRANSIQPGDYTVEATSAGLAPAKKHAAVAIGQATTLSLVLGGATATESLEVTAEAPVIQTENANIATTHDSREIELLPNGGGDQTYIAQTSPGVNINTASGGGYGNFSAFGLPGTSNLFTVNGNDNMDPYLNLNNSGATNLTLGANELSEVTVVDNGYSVNYGRQAGAQVNSVTKSGGNAFHGNAIYWWNGRALNADNWFNKHVDTNPIATDPSGGGTITPTPFVNVNQWAASIGGPIKKDKLFFFVDNEGLRVVVPVQATVFSPSQAYENYVLNTALPGAGNASSVPFYQKLFSNYNNAPGYAKGTPVTAAVDPALGCGDLGSIPGGACAVQYAQNFSNFAKEWTLATRVDWNISDTDKFYVRYHQDKGLQPTYTDTLSPIFNTQSNQPSYDGQLSETHTFGTRAVNQFILSGAYYRAIFLNSNQAQSLQAFPATLLFGDGLFSGVGGENYIFPQGRNVTQYQITDDFNYNAGNHSLHVGVNYRRNDITDYATSVLAVAPEIVAFSMTDFSQGFADEFVRRFPQRPSNPVALWSAGFYGQDDWRVTSNFKLNLGLRADHYSNPVCHTNCFNRVAGSTYASVPKDPTVPYNQIIKTGLNTAYPNTEAVNLQPRVGFAWSPFGSNRGTVVRGGFGLFYDLLPATVIDNYIRNAPGVIQIVDLNGDNLAPGVAGSAWDVASNGAAAFQSGFANGATFSKLAATVPGFTGVSLQTSEQKVKTPEYQEWNLEIQQSLGSKTSISANYVGNHGIHIPMYTSWGNVSCRSAATCGGLTAYGIQVGAAPNRAFTTDRELNSTGYSKYDGIVFAFTRRFSKGLQTQVSYTYSHALDTVSNGGILPWSSNDSSLTQYLPNSSALNYGNADYDVRQAVNANYVYQLPFKSDNRLFNTFIGGWTVAGTLFFHTGYPFSVFDPSSDLTNSKTGLRNASAVALPAYIVGSPNYSSCTSGPNIDVRNIAASSCLIAGDFAKNSFSTPVGPLFGFQPGLSNQRRNQFRGPGYFNTDLSVMKNFKLTERFQLGLGANAYNVLNHPNFGNPTGSLNGSLGNFFTTVNPPTSALGSGLGGDAASRSLQLTARVTF